MQVGDTIDGYVLKYKCGSGAFGTVFIAEGIAGNRVALKAVSSLGTAADRELKALKSYQKCNQSDDMLKIFHIAKKDDFLYYTMEVADGVPLENDYVPDTLAERLKHCSCLSVKDTTVMLCQLLKALDVLHRNNLIHRDIKPSNIFWVKGKAKLGDIGLLIQEDSMTMNAGTPYFMPPPEYGVDWKSPQVDLYALAKVAYCCVTGNPPERYPEMDFTDDIIEHGSALTKFINLGCGDNKTLFSCVQDAFDVLGISLQPQEEQAAGDNEEAHQGGSSDFWSTAGKVGLVAVSVFGAAALGFLGGAQLKK